MTQLLLSVGNIQGLGQAGRPVYDEDSFIDDNIVIPNVPLKASVRKQNSCAETKFKCIYINNSNGFWRNKTYIIDFQLHTHKSFIKRPGNLTAFLIFGNIVRK